MATNEPNFDELNDKADKGELTPENLQTELNKYAAAIESEFRIASAGSPENVDEYARDFFKKNIHSAAAQIVWLAVNSTSDSVRLAASKYVVEQAISDAKGDGDPLKDLMKELSATKKKEPTK